MPSSQHACRLPRQEQRHSTPLKLHRLYHRCGEVRNFHVNSPSALRLDAGSSNAGGTRESFLEHILTCKQALKVWCASENGEEDISYLENQLIRSNGITA